MGPRIVSNSLVCPNQVETRVVRYKIHRCLPNLDGNLVCSDRSIHHLIKMGTGVRRQTRCRDGYLRLRKSTASKGLRMSQSARHCCICSPVFSNHWRTGGALVYVKLSTTALDGARGHVTSDLILNVAYVLNVEPSTVVRSAQPY